ncbi:MAG: HAMP domain-containing protein [Gammaproteobacteria bacterium]|nr:HAMP domain-containing protein [Gammaproteobacteria bacterium]
MQWLSSRLSRKFAVGTASGLLASSLVFLVLFLALYRAELASERSATAVQVNQLLQTSLENAMLKRDLEGLRVIVEHLGTQPGIEAVFIANPRGEIRFASKPDMLGHEQAPPTQRHAAYTEFVSNPQGGEILRSVNPVPNRAPCKECHGPAEQHPINGVLYVDYDAAPIRRKASRTTLLLMGAGATIVLLNLAGGWWFIRRHVIAPVDHLTRTSRALAQGELDVRAALRGDDELAQLGGTFNLMADQLQERIDEAEQQRRFLQSLIDAIPDGVRVITPTYRVLLTNRAYREQLGLGEADGVGDTCHGVSHNCTTPCPATLVTCPVHEIAVNAQPVKALHRHHGIAGQVTDVEIYAAPMHAIVDGQQQTLAVESIRDLSRQIKYSHEHKLSELGKLATGVAHEIYNPLTSVRLALDALRQGVDDADRETIEYLALVEREMDKCVTVTERLLRLGMPASETLELVDVAAVISDTFSLVRWEAEQAAVTLTADLQPDLRVMASDSELRMVILNLVQNAFHAMPDGGTLRATSRRTSTAIEITVHDNGIGIDAQRLPRIFDPFYSRRADGSKGAGLGLSIVRTIVENYGGRIDAVSDPGSGSEFIIKLPDASTATEEPA